MKKTQTLIFVLGLGVLIGLSACNNSPKEEKSDNQTVQSETEESSQATMEETEKFAKGKEIYEQKCIVCHMADGKGQTGVFPPLAGSDYLLADKIRAVRQVLNGSNEGITVNGVTYSTPMPAQTDNVEEAVEVVNYILNAWGNNGGTVSLDEVKDIEIIR